MALSEPLPLPRATRHPLGSRPVARGRVRGLASVGAEELPVSQADTTDRDPKYVGGVLLQPSPPHLPYAESWPAEFAGREPQNVGPFRLINRCGSGEFMSWKFAPP